MKLLKPIRCICATIIETTVSSHTICEDTSVSVISLTSSNLSEITSLLMIYQRTSICATNRDSGLLNGNYTILLPLSDNIA
jgi:hypothetical protein